MHFEIGKNGISFIDFTVSLDRNSTRVHMNSDEDLQKLYKERDRISHLFGATIISSNCIEFNHGSYSAKSVARLKETVLVLNEKSFIDSQHFNEITRLLEERLTQVKLENQQETAQFALLLGDFKKHIEQPYKELSRHHHKLFTDSLYPIDYLIYEVNRYRANPMKVGSHWFYLFLFEGALDHLHKSLRAQENHVVKERVGALNHGLRCFLEAHEKELHAAIEKTIHKNALWFQELYSKYKLMIKTGKSPLTERYGPITNRDLSRIRLILPDRLAKSKL